eukprot:symbB.v1.2.023179.t1/scaffold2105.1/size89348/1
MIEVIERSNYLKVNTCEGETKLKLIGHSLVGSAFAFALLFGLLLAGANAYFIVIAEPAPSQQAQQVRQCSCSLELARRVSPTCRLKISMRPAPMWRFTCPTASRQAAIVPRSPVDVSLSFLTCVGSGIAHLVHTPRRFATIITSCRSWRLWNLGRSWKLWRESIQPHLNWNIRSAIDFCKCCLQATWKLLLRDTSSNAESHEPKMLLD